jgi:hypothetical protein
MHELSKILSVIDPTVKEQPGMHRAAWLAKRTGAELELLVCYYNEYLSGDRLFDSPSLEKARNEVIGSHSKHLERSGIIRCTRASCAMWSRPEPTWWSRTLIITRRSLAHC